MKAQHTRSREYQATTKSSECERGISIAPKSVLRVGIMYNATFVFCAPAARKKKLSPRVCNLCHTRTGTGRKKDAVTTGSMSR